MNILFSSDHHFFHGKILEYCSGTRGHFISIEGMNEHLISSWNSVVGKKDLIYHLGDFGFGSVDRLVEILGRLNGRKILIPGNHDQRFLGNEKFVSEFSEVLSPLVEIKVSKEPVVLCHFPILNWNRKHYGVLHLHGHSHGGLSYDQNALDVGCDGRKELSPWTFEEIKEAIKNRE